MSASDLTKFLWKEHNLVYLRPANAVDFELLDVLVKVKAKGIFRPRPLLRRIGSIFGVAGSTRVQLKRKKGEKKEDRKGGGEKKDGEKKEEERRIGSISVVVVSTGAQLKRKDGEKKDKKDGGEKKGEKKDGEKKEEEEGKAEREEEVTLEVQKQELHELRSYGSSGSRGKDIHTFDHGQRWRSKSEVSASLKGSAMEVGALGVGGAAGQEFTINNVESDSVDSIALAKCLSSATNPWTPNIDFIRQWCSPRNKKELELWVVTKLFYHSGIQSGSTTELDAGVGISELPVKFGARCKKSSSTDVQPTSWIPFGYQAIRLRYSLQYRKLTNPRLDMGTRRPVEEAKKDVLVEESIIIIPDGQPDFNMDELLDMEAWDSLEIETTWPGRIE